MKVIYGFLAASIFSCSTAKSKKNSEVPETPTEKQETKEPVRPVSDKPVEEVRPEAETPTGPIQVQQELISCRNVRNILGDCKVREGVLMEAQHDLSDFYVSYKMTCGRGSVRPVPSDIVLALESPGMEKRLDFNGSYERILVGTGFGPLTLKDTFQSSLGILLFPLNGCSLVISKVEAVKK